MTLDQDLALPQRHQAAVLSLLLVAHVAINLGFEVKPEKIFDGKKNILMSYICHTLVSFPFLFYENYLELYLKAPFFGRNSFT